MSLVNYSLQGVAHVIVLDNFGEGEFWMLNQVFQGTGQVKSTVGKLSSAVVTFTQGDQVHARLQGLPL